MPTTRRTVVLGMIPLGGLSFLSTLPALAAGDADAVARTLEAFRTAQAALNAAGLMALCAPELTYSHSDGRIEDRATFVANATSGKSTFVSLEYLEPMIKVIGDTAIVRFHWVAEQQAVADGKKTPTNLHILMAWQKQGSEWKLLARGATKLA